MQKDNERESRLIGDSKQDKPRRVTLESMAEEGKPFIEEKVKKNKKKKSKARKFFISLLSSLLLGIIFGTAACAAFFILKPYMEEYFKEEEDDQRIPDFSFSPQGNKSEMAVSTDSSVGTGSSVETASPGEENTPSETASPGETGTGSGGSQGIRQPKKELTVKDYARLSGQFSSYAQKMEKSVLTVTTVKEKKDIFDHTEITADSFYGLVLGEHGQELIVLTPYEKVKGDNKIQATFHEGLTLEADIINQDSELGISILGIQLKDIPAEIYNDLEIANLGESYYLSVGSPLMILGSPNGYMYSRGIGNVSTKPYIKYIQDDCVELFNTDMMPYNKGEGFLVNLNGEVVGFLTHNFSDDMNKDMCVVMGISKIKQNIEDLINVKSRASFGIRAWDMTKESLESLGKEKGIYISEVIPDSAAYEAGIINGDVIISLGGRDVSSVKEFHEILRTMKPEDEVKVMLVRTATADAPEMTLEVILKERDKK